MLCFWCSDGKVDSKLGIFMSMNLVTQLLFIVKRDIQAGDEEGIKMKEQAILNLGKMLSKHGKAEGT